MIDAIKLYNLRNADFIQFNKDVATVINRNNATTLLVKPQYDALMLKIAELETLFITVTSNPKTAELEALDLRRDKAINGLMGLVKNFTNHFQPSMAQAAMALQSNLDLYGSGIAKETYQRETVLISNLIADWQTKPELQTAVDMLGILDWVLELKTVNDEFGEKYIDRAQDYGSESPENLKSKRSETMEAYYTLRKRLESHADIEGTPIYVTTINEINAIIELYNRTLKGRTSTVKNTETISPN